VAGAGFEQGDRNVLRSELRRVGGELSVTRRSVSRTDRDSVVSTRRKRPSPAQERGRQFVARAFRRRGSDEHGRCCSTSGNYPVSVRGRPTFQKNVRSGYSRRIVPISRFTTGCGIGACGIEFASTISSTRTLASQRRSRRIVIGGSLPRPVGESETVGRDRCSSISVAADRQWCG
jgi:hypothetical protein